MEGIPGRLSTTRNDLTIQQSAGDGSLLQKFVMSGADVQEAEKAKQRQFSELESGRYFVVSVQF